MHTPQEARALTGLSDTSLRRYTALFAEWLSPLAQAPITADGTLGARQFTSRDVALMRAIKREYDAKRKTGQIKAMLQAGALQPLIDVVDDNTGSPATAGENAAMARFEAAVAGASLDQFLALSEQLRTVLPALSASHQSALQAREELAALAEQQAAMLHEQRELLEEIRQERAALAAEREAAVQYPEVPVQPVPLGQRLKRLFTGGT